MLLLLATDSKWYMTYLTWVSLKIISLLQAFSCAVFQVYTFGIAFHVAITGEDRSFEFDTDVDRSKS